MNPSTLTLRVWYERHFVSLFHVDARPRTVEEYSATLNHWERFNSNVTLSEITSIAIAEFRAKLSEQMSAATTNKHLRHLNHLLSKAGPPGPRNRDALGLITIAPWAKQLRTFQRRPRAAGLPAIRLFYRACPNDWWRAFVVCAFHLGSRVKALLHVRDCDVDWSRRTVGFAPEFDKRRCERLKPMSRHVLKHLVLLRGLGLLSWTRSLDLFYDTWHRIEEQAGIVKEDRFTPHGLKRACGTQLARAGTSPWAVKYMLDHSQTDVTGCSYLDPIEELFHYVDRLPDPSVLNEEVRIDAT